MSRIKIVFPDKAFLFSTRLPVLIQHVNYGGHLGNDSVLSLLHEARLRYLQYLGCSEMDACGAALIMTDVAITYKGEGFQGDLLDVFIVAADLTSRGFDLYYKIDCERDGRKIAIAEAKTGMLCFDYKSRRPVHMPDLLRKKLSDEA